VEHIEQAPFTGVFEWIQLLEQSDRMRDTLEADWFHLNSPDEIISSNRRGERLADAIQRIDGEGYTAINYDEFVFLPADPHLQCTGMAFDEMISHYYFYEPRPMRQYRSWKNLPGITCADGCGHRLAGPPLNVYPENQELRHYIALNAAEFHKKYADRKFNDDELAKGWHANRLSIDPDHMRLPGTGLLKQWTSDDPTSLDRSEPWKKHFWELPARSADPPEKRRGFWPPGIFRRRSLDSS
jgi:hypothetical protein